MLSLTSLTKASAPASNFKLNSTWLRIKHSNQQVSDCSLAFSLSTASARNLPANLSAVSKQFAKLFAFLSLFSQSFNCF